MKSLELGRTSSSPFIGIGADLVVKVRERWPLWLLMGLVGALVGPPFLYLAQTSLQDTAVNVPTLINFSRVLELSGTGLWINTLAYATGSSLAALALGVPTAWLVARTNAPFRGLASTVALASLAFPVIVKGVGWILLLGPNSGVINVWLRSLLGLTHSPIQLFSLGGMILVEAILWTPVVLLLTLPSLSAMDPALEEAALTAGAGWWNVLRRVTFPLARPGMLAVLLLTFVRSLESFEVPLLIGTPGGIETFTTAIYSTVNSGLMPRYGEASAYSVLLVLVVALPLVLYYRATREAQRFATVTGKGYRPRPWELGWLRIPCGVWLLGVSAALVAPLLILLWASFVPVYTSPSLQDLGRLTLGNYRSVLTRPLVLAGLRNSLVVSVASAAGVAALGFAVAWVVARRREGIRWVLDFMASLPLVFPGIVLGIAVLREFLQLKWIPIYGTVWVMVFAFVVRFLPYGLRYCHTGILAVHRELEEAASVHGARWSTTLQTVVLPLAFPAVFAAWSYVFLVTVRDLSVSVLLAGPASQVISVVILDLWDNGEIPEMGAFSVALVAVLVVTTGLFRRLGGRPGQMVEV